KAFIKTIVPSSRLASHLLKSKNVLELARHVGLGLSFHFVASRMQVVQAVVYLKRRAGQR
ncbi:unnamed protein product, partial [Sphenostylis stenocarpa]